MLPFYDLYGVFAPFFFKIFLHHLLDFIPLDSVDRSADETVDFSTAGEKFFDSSIVQENRKKEKILLHFIQKKKQQLSLLLRCRR